MSGFTWPPAMQVGCHCLELPLHERCPTNVTLLSCDVSMSVMSPVDESCVLANHVCLHARSVQSCTQAVRTLLHRSCSSS